MIEAVAQHQPDDEITLEVESQGEQRSVSVTLGERPAELDAQPGPSIEAGPQIEAGGTLQILGLRARVTAEGLVIESLDPDSPLAATGLQEGDVITAINGMDVTDLAPGQLLRSLRSGQSVTVTVLRDGESLDLTFEVPTLDEALAPMMPGMGQFFMFGRTVPELLSLLGVSVSLTDEGLSIDRIEPDSVLAESELQEGDVITDLNRVPLNDFDPQALWESLEAGEPLTLTVLRDGQEVEITLELPSLDELEAMFQDLMPMFEGMMPGMMQGFDNMGHMLMSMLGVGLRVTEDGLLVESLTPGSPVAEAGLQEGDVITAINGMALDALDPMPLLESLAESGSVTLTVVHEGQEVELEFELPELDEMFPGQMMMPGTHMPGFAFGAQGRPQLGVVYLTLTAEIAAEQNLAVEEGALIEEVLDDTPAAEAGLQAGDIIVAVDGDPVDQRRTLPERLYAYDEGEQVTLSVLRDGEELEIDVVLGPNAAGRGGMFGFGPGQGWEFGPGSERGPRRFGPMMPFMWPDMERMPDEFFEHHPFLAPDGMFEGDAEPAPAPDVPESPANNDEAAA